MLRQPGGRHACLYGTNFDKGSPGANAIIAGQPFSDASKCNKVVTPNGLELYSISLSHQVGNSAHVISIARPLLALSCGSRQSEALGATSRIFRNI